MVTRSEDALDGMAEICAYVRRSAPTVLRFIRERGFPAKKESDGRGGVWTASKKAVDRWREQYTRGEA